MDTDFIDPILSNPEDFLLSTTQRSFKPSVTVPWLATGLAPFVVGPIVNAVAGPITKATPDKEVRVRNGIATLTTGVASFFSWRAALDPEVYPGLQAAAGVTGVLFGLLSILGFFSTIGPGPLAKSKSDLSRIQSYLLKGHALSKR